MDLARTSAIVLIKAFAEIFAGRQGYNLKICGDGPRKTQLQRLAFDLGVQTDVEFLGQLSKGEILRRIDGAHVVVLSSRVETFGVPLIEAMARGRPVIATRCGEPITIVTPECGILVEVDNVAQMGAALQQMSTGIKIYDPDAIRQSSLRRYGPEVFRRTAVSMYQAALKNTK